MELHPCPSSKQELPISGDAVKLLLIGVDGLRIDRAFGTGLAPNLDLLASSGHLLYSQIEGPTISGPSWATILTGATHADHGIDDNLMLGHRLSEYPDFLTRAHQQDPSVTTYAAAGWPLLTDPAGLGPIVRLRQEQIDEGTHGVVSLNGELYGYRAIDPEIAARGRNAISDAGPDLSFIYFCETDDAGHHFGVFTPEYDTAISNSDRNIGTLLDAVDSRVQQHDESWIVAVTTDHGHRDEGGHGGSTPEEVQTFLLASARGVTLPSGLPESMPPREYVSWLLDLREQIADRPNGDHIELHSHR